LKWNERINKWEIATSDAFVNATVDANKYLNVHARTVDQLPSDLTTAGNLKVSVEEASIRVPVDKQAVYRVLVTETTSTLDANATYTGNSVDCNDYTHFHGFVYADVDGTLKIQVSSNGSDWYEIKSVSVSGGNTVTFNEEVIARYYRVVYVNGATAQSSFRLEVYKVVR